LNAGEMVLIAVRRQKLSRDWDRANGEVDVEAEGGDRSLV
jgi:hypothetical protein